MHKATTRKLSRTRILTPVGHALAGVSGGCPFGLDEGKRIRFMASLLEVVRKFVESSDSLSQN